MRLGNTGSGGCAASGLVRRPVLRRGPGDRVRVDHDPHRVSAAPPPPPRPAPALHRGPLGRPIDAFRRISTTDMRQRRPHAARSSSSSTQRADHDVPEYPLSQAAFMPPSPTPASLQPRLSVQTAPSAASTGSAMNWKSLASGSAGPAHRGTSTSGTRSSTCACSARSVSRRR